MSESSITEKVLMVLWGRAGGRCEYENCNKNLTIDTITKRLRNRGYVAHIYADKQGGPRWDPQKSPKLKKDISNLMLLCDECHRRIDKDEVQEHPAERLIEMKKRHEKWVDSLLNTKKKIETIPLKYSANIHNDKIQIDDSAVMNAIVEDNNIPKTATPFDLSLQNSEIYDNEDAFWNAEKTNLSRRLNKVLETCPLANNFSICAIAPQPLLIFLGTLLNEKKDVTIYQKHHNSDNWYWDKSKKNDSIDFNIIPPKAKCKSNVAINFSLSANIEEKSIYDSIGNDVAIWTLTIDNPNPNFVTSKNILMEFNAKLVNLLNKLKNEYPNCKEINIFPAVPVSIALEIGRSRMPKSDLPFVLFDRNNQCGGFIEAFKIE